MDKYGCAMICTVQDVSDEGDGPDMRLVPLFDAYYEKLKVGVTRLYAAMGAGHRVDALLRLENAELPRGGDIDLYAIVEDVQYRIAAAQDDEEDTIITLERMDKLYEIADS